MNSDFIIVDTDVLIDFSRGVEEAKVKLNELELHYTLALSVVTQLELMVGCGNKSDFNALQKFLYDFEIIQLTGDISKKSVQLFQKYRLSHGVLIPDMLIAATAITCNIPLCSKNRKDFHFIKEIEFVEYNG